MAPVLNRSEEALFMDSTRAGEAREPRAKQRDEKTRSARLSMGLVSRIEE